MPRIKESEDQLKDNITRASIKRGMELTKKSQCEIAARVGFTKRTFQNKCKRPETFTLGEFRKVCKILKISGEEKKEII